MYPSWLRDKGLGHVPKGHLGPNPLHGLPQPSCTPKHRASTEQLRLCSSFNRNSMCIEARWGETSEGDDVGRRKASGKEDARATLCHPWPVCCHQGAQETLGMASMAEMGSRRMRMHHGMCQALGISGMW